MGRRKKEPPEEHRRRIADAAETLFIENGISAASMEDIAKFSGYSKATLYVYFQNKNDIVGFLTLRGMRMLLEHIRSAIRMPGSVEERYFLICEELAAFQRENPFYFEIILNEINVDFEKPDALEIEREIFAVGEQMTLEIASFLSCGMDQGIFRGDLNVTQTVFLFWSSLSGMISMASKKEVYIQKAMNLSRQEFLRQGFQTLYRTIRKETLE